VTPIRYLLYEMGHTCIFVTAPYWCNVLPQSLSLAGSVLKISTVFGWLQVILNFGYKLFYVVLDYFKFLFNVCFFHSCKMIQVACRVLIYGSVS